ncbi:3-ketoacyl-ACP reductase [Photobacterium rosenbergii]|uniref:3-ketoacyl-ACP reductase n=1 Tax=Photobacterium rosenbergii TaxID=294936 RepID=A0A2T3NMP8_9GAMM|nr:3-ketoacyl-ACP reductase [Photobacterium rosenbergii]MBY5946477.1 3-ketoacyl-ACP reductase [Photobacterium rosenbergii]PSW16781.1 3-ketoacyl-ACP reductase [Photobacterium rosenbergii]
MDKLFSLLNKFASIVAMLMFVIGGGMALFVFFYGP